MMGRRDRKNEGVRSSDANIVAVDNSANQKSGGHPFKPMQLTHRISPLQGGKYAVTLPSRGITVVAKDITQARILDNAESVIEANG